MSDQKVNLRSKTPRQVDQGHAHDAKTHSANGGLPAAKADKDEFSVFKKNPMHDAIRQQKEQERNVQGTPTVDHAQRAQEAQVMSVKDFLAHERSRKA